MPTLTSAVYLATNAGPIEKRRVSNGSLVWSSVPVGAMTPGAAQGLIVDGALRALSPLTGAIVWKAFLGIPVGPVAVDGSTAFVVTDNNYVHAVDVTSGNVLWKTFARERGTVAVGEGLVFLPASPGLLPLSGATGAPVWAARVLAVATAYANGRVHASCGVALDASTGNKLWDRSSIPFATSPAIANGILYCGATDGTMCALDAATGTTRWTFQTGGFGGQNLAVANGVLYVPSSDHVLYALDAKTGQELWRTTLGGAVLSAVVSHGALYATAADDTLHAWRLPGS